MPVPRPASGASWPDSSVHLLLGEGRVVFTFPPPAASWPDIYARLLLGEERVVVTRPAPGASWLDIGVRLVNDQGWKRMREPYRHVDNLSFSMRAHCNVDLFRLPLAQRTVMGHGLRLLLKVPEGASHEAVVVSGCLCVGETLAAILSASISALVLQTAVVAGQTPNTICMRIVPGSD